MFCSSISWLIYAFVAVAIATGCSGQDAITGPDPEDTVHHLRTHNPESSTEDPLETPNTAVDLGALLEAGEGAVVTLVAGDTRLVAHRAVLSARSAVFQRILQDAATGEVAIPDVEGPVLRQLVSYLYTLQAPQLPAMAPQLLVAADHYGLPALKADCEQQVAKQLSVETAVAAAVLSVRHSCDNLRKAAIAYIRAHIFQVMATQGWADAIKSQPQVMIKVMQLLSQSPTETSSPVLEESGASPHPTTGPHSDFSGHSDHQTPATATPTVPTQTITPTVDDSISHLRNLSSRDKDNRLIEAAKQGSVGELEALLAVGADVGARDEDNMTALHYAAERGHEDVARRLLAAGAAVDDRGFGQWTPLHWAARRGHASVVRLLLAAGADHTARDGLFVFTPLHWAAAKGHTEVAAALLEAGADRGLRDAWGNTPLDVARQSNEQQLVDLLRASLPAPGESGTSSYHATQPQSGLNSHSDHQTPATATPTVPAQTITPTVDDYISLLRNLSSRGKDNRLIEAAKEGAVRELEALLAAGADVGARGEENMTALHYAAREGHEEAASRLLAAGAAVDDRDKWELTPLLWAARRGQAAVVRLLLAAGADHTARDGYGWTALHWAAYWGHTEAAASLLQGGADRGACSTGGETPLDVARRYNNRQLVNLLQAR